jgi:sugar/nucleoside kinase (ribokinase family)
MMIGHFAKDRIVVDGRGELVSGGGVYYGGVAARRLGLSVAVVTRLHPDDFPRLGELKEEGILLYASPAPETSGIENIYNSSDMERRLTRPLGFAGPFSPAEIPDVAARIVAVVSIMAGEVDIPLLKALAGRGPLAVDVQGFVRVRDAERGGLLLRAWPEIADGLAPVTYLKADRAEAELLTGQTDLHTAARRLAEYGPREVVLTESSGVTVFAEGRMHHAPFTPRSLAGRTGRGDTCFAVYLGARLTHPPEEAARLAAAVTTLKQERPGPWRGTLDDVKTTAEG